MCKIKEKVEEWKQNAKLQLSAGKWKNPLSQPIVPLSQKKGWLI
jgi:hypothetical protein